MYSIFYGITVYFLVTFKILTDFLLRFFKVELISPIGPEFSQTLMFSKKKLTTNSIINRIFTDFGFKQVANTGKII